MPSREQLETALRNADAAGDHDAAVQLATALKNGQYDQSKPSNERTYEGAKETGSKIVDFGKKIIGGSNLAGDIETGMQVGSGLAGSLIGGLSAIGAGTGELIKQAASDQPIDMNQVFNKASQVQGAVSGAIPVYTPVTPDGTAESELLGNVMESKYNPLNIAKTINKAIGASNFLAEKGYPGAATALDIGGDLLVGMGVNKLAKTGLEAAQAARINKSAMGQQEDITAPQIIAEQPKVEQPIGGVDESQSPMSRPDEIRTQNVAEAFANEGMKDRINTIAGNITLNPERVAAAERLGIKAPIATLSDDRALQEVAGALAAAPGSRAASELAQYHQQLTGAAKKLIEDAGGDLDKGLINTQLKDDMAANIKLLNDQSSDIYKAIDQAVPKDTIVNTKPLIRELNARASKSEKGIAGLSDVEQDVFNTLKGKPTYFDVDNLRKDIGESIGGLKGTYHKSSSAPLKDMYAKLTELQEGVATQVGSGAGKLWNDAKALDKARFRLQENSEFLFGKDLTGSVTTQVEQGLKTLAKGDIKKFNEVIKSIPPEQKQRVLVSGLDSLIQKTQQGEVAISPVQFNAWYGELSRSPTNKRLLMQHLPEGAEQRLDDLFKLSQGMQNVTTKITRTGIVSDAFKNFDKNGGLIDRLYNTADKIDNIPVVGAAVGAPAVRVASNLMKMAVKKKTPAIEAADELLANPAFKTSILEYQKTGKIGTENQKKLKASASYKKYLGTQNDARRLLIEKNGLVPFLLAGDANDQ